MRRWGLAGVIALGCGGDDGRAVPWQTTGTEGSGGATTASDATTMPGDDASSTSSTSVEPGSSEDTAAPPDLPAVDDCPRVRVVSPEEVLNVRPDPSTAGTPIGQLADGTIVSVIAEAQGEAIEGDTLWYEIDYFGQSGFVSGVFVECTLDEPPEPPDGFYLPLPCGMQAVVTQGNMGDVSHYGLHTYAFDFGVVLDTPLLAMAAGTVSLIFDETGPGDPRYDGGGPECSAYGNLVILSHGDGTATLYKHLNAVQVAPGDVVERGAQIGLSGTSGYSTGRHAHIMRMENCGELTCQSIPMEFVEAGVPVMGETVTSQNCP
jgi:hypothetical protein